MRRTDVAGSGKVSLAEGYKNYEPAAADGTYRVEPAVSFLSMKFSHYNATFRPTNGKSERIGSARALDAAKKLAEEHAAGKRAG